MKCSFSQPSPVRGTHFDGSKVASVSAPAAVMHNNTISRAPELVMKFYDTPSWRRVLLSGITRRQSVEAKEGADEFY